MTSGTISDGPEVKNGPKLDLPPQGPYGLIGREHELARLEHSFQSSSIVLVTGPAGIGKTELACGFARWLVDKEGRTGEAIFTSFEYGAGLYRLLHELGTTLSGISFAALSLQEQRQWLVSYMRQNACLLVWDNFEKIFEYLDDNECHELIDFLRDISDGPTYILITGLVEAWINVTGIGHGREELGGLGDAEAEQLAGLVLGKPGEDTIGSKDEYLNLLRLLQGSPMSMRVLLPHLNSNTPSELVHALHQTRPSCREEGADLSAALDCSFSHLAPRTRIHLSFLSLFQQRVLLDVLTFMTQGEIYASIVGEKMGWGACRTFLREARECGILEAVSPSVYQIPASVSMYLRQQLALRLTAAQVADLEQEFVRVYADMGDYFLENLSSEDPDSTVTGVLAEEANLLQALHLAQEAGNWEYAQLILQPLAQVYKMQERVMELRRLRHRLLAYAGAEADQAEERGSIEFWLYLQGTEVDDAIGRGELDTAESICHSVLTYLKSSSNPSAQPRIAWTYHQLGLIAQGRDQHSQAEVWYKDALKINESLGNEAESADSYHQLGLIAQSRRLYDDADEWHRKALEIRERLGDEAEAGSECHQLALVSEARSQFQDALEWYHRARLAYEHVDDKANSAIVYHQIGLISHVQYDYEEAAGWYQKAVTVYDELGDEVGGANDYYQLGIIALHSDDNEGGEEYVRQALRAYQQLHNEAGTAGCYHHLGLLAHARQQRQDAELWYQAALEIFLRSGDEAAAASTWGQLGSLAQERGDYDHAVWYVAHAHEIAVSHQLPLLHHTIGHLSDLRSKMGAERFIRCWDEVSGADILRQLE